MGHEGVDSKALVQQVTDGDLVDHRYLQAEVGAAEPGRFAFGMGQHGRKVGIVQQCEGPTAGVGVPISGRLTGTIVKISLAIGHEPGVIDITAVVQQLGIDVAHD